MTLHTLGLVGAGSGSLEVCNDRPGLEVDLAPRRTYGKGQVHVLVIRGRKPCIESAELREQRRGNRKTRARTVVDLAHIVVFGFVGIVVPAIVPSRAVAPYDATGFLEAAIRIDELGADQPGVGVPLENREHRFEPALGWNGIVVEKDEDRAARRLRAAIAAADKAQVGFVAHKAHAANGGKR